MNLCLTLTLGPFSAWFWPRSGRAYLYRTPCLTAAPCPAGILAIPGKPILDLEGPLVGHAGARAPLYFQQITDASGGNGCAKMLLIARGWAVAVGHRAFGGIQCALLGVSQHDLSFLGQLRRVRHDAVRAGDAVLGHVRDQLSSDDLTIERRVQPLMIEDQLWWGGGVTFASWWRFCARIRDQRLCVGEHLASPEGRRGWWGLATQGHLACDLERRSKQPWRLIWRTVSSSTIRKLAHYSDLIFRSRGLPVRFKLLLCCFA